jgi:hypothetical protein
MLKTILNLNGVELLSKEQKKNIVGKLGAVAKCSDGNWAPPGATQATYPNYPCINVEGTPHPRLCLEPGRGGEVYFC